MGEFDRYSAIVSMSFFDDVHIEYFIYTVIMCATLLLQIQAVLQSITFCFTVLYRTVQYSTFCVCVLPYHIACLCHCDMCVTLYNALCVILYVDFALEAFS